MLWQPTVARSLARCIAGCSLLLASLASAQSAEASPFDVFGFGTEGIAEVSARTARAQDGTATFYNPAGLAFGTGYRAQLSGLAAITGLKASGNTQEIHNPVGGTLAVDLDVPLEGPLAKRVRIGLGMYALPTMLMRLHLQEATTPFFPYYDNRTQRLTAIPALALRPFDCLGIGVGVNVLAGVAGPVDVREGQSRGLESRVEAESKTVASLVLGARFEVSPRVRFGATYRQRFGVPLKITTTASVAGVPLFVDVAAAETLFDPATVVLAGSFDASDNLTFELDGSYHRWSTWAGPLLAINTTVSALSLSTHPPNNAFRDTFGVRGAGAWRLLHDDRRELKLHLGAGYESSMLRSDFQQGRTNFLDGDKVFLGIGGSALFRKTLGSGLRVGAAYQAQIVTAYSQDKIACTQVPCPSNTVVGPDTANPSQGITNPGYPTLTGSGMVHVVSVGVGVDL